MAQYKKHDFGLRRGDPALIAKALGMHKAYIHQILYGRRHNAQVLELVALARQDYDTFVLRLARERELTELKRRVAK